MPRGYRRDLRFVNFRDQDSREISRRHVTREFYREKRWHEAHGATISAQDDEDLVSDELTPEFVISVIRLGPRKKRHRKASEKPNVPEHMEEAVDDDAALGPTTSLGAGRLDPFSSYPIPADSAVHQLVDHYIYVLPSTLHASHGDQSKQRLPIHKIFDVYRQDAGSFLVMLQHSAQNLAILNSNQNDPRVIEYRYRSLQHVRNKLQRSEGRYSDLLIMTVALLANAEVRLTN